jgi:hypothetical protein
MRRQGSSIHNLDVTLREHRPFFEPMTGSLGNHLIRRPSPISWIWPVTLAHRHAALWQPPLILTTHAAALLRLATARHPSAPSIPKLLVVIAVRTHAFLLLLQRSHHYTRWTSLRTSRPGSPSGSGWCRPQYRLWCVESTLTQYVSEWRMDTSGAPALEHQIKKRCPKFKFVQPPQD